MIGPTKNVLESELLDFLLNLLPLKNKIFCSLFLRFHWNACFVICMFPGSSKVCVWSRSSFLFLFALEVVTEVLVFKGPGYLHRQMCHTWESWFAWYAYHMYQAPYDNHLFQFTYYHIIIITMTIFFSESYDYHMFSS